MATRARVDIISGSQDQTINSSEAGRVERLLDTHYTTLYLGGHT